MGLTIMFGSKRGLLGRYRMGYGLFAQEGGIAMRNKKNATKVKVGDSGLQAMSCIGANWWSER